MWVEVNSRVNYPRKDSLNYLVHYDLVDMEDGLHKFCVSYVTLMTAHSGLQRLVAASNTDELRERGFRCSLCLRGLF